MDKLLALSLLVVCLFAGTITGGLIWGSVFSVITGAVAGLVAAVFFIFAIVWLRARFGRP